MISKKEKKPSGIRDSAIIKRSRLSLRESIERRVKRCVLSRRDDSQDGGSLLGIFFARPVSVGDPRCALLHSKRQPEKLTRSEESGGNPSSNFCRTLGVCMSEMINLVTAGSAWGPAIRTIASRRVSTCTRLFFTLEDTRAIDRSAVSSWNKVF